MCLATLSFYIRDMALQNVASFQNTEDSGEREKGWRESVGGGGRSSSTFPQFSFKQGRFEETTSGEKQYSIGLDTKKLYKWR